MSAHQGGAHNFRALAMIMPRVAGVSRAGQTFPFTLFPCNDCLTLEKRVFQGDGAERKRLHRPQAKLEVLFQSLTPFEQIPGSFCNLGVGRSSFMIRLQDSGLILSNLMCPSSC